MFFSSLNRLQPQTKQALRDFGRKFGFEIRPSGINSRDDLRFVHFLKKHNIDTVLDVGANKGQFASGLFKAGFKGRIISFEPLPDAGSELTKAADKLAANWIVGPQVALSDKAGTAKFHVTEANTSSSLLEPLDRFVDIMPQVRVDQTIDVKTDRLDALWPELALDKRRVFLKLDVQGSEAAVLAGATEALAEVHDMLVELSLVGLYAGQSSVIAVQQLLADLGFEIWDIWRGYSDPNTKRLNQIDALYFRSEKGTD